MPPTLTYRTDECLETCHLPYSRARVEPCCAYSPSFYRGFGGPQHPIPVQDHGIGAQNATKTERRAVLKGVSLAWFWEYLQMNTEIIKIIIVVTIVLVLPVLVAVALHSLSHEWDFTV